jgi:hypothetical protein
MFRDRTVAAARFEIARGFSREPELACAGSAVAVDGSWKTVPDESRERRDRGGVVVDKFLGTSDL